MSSALHPRPKKQKRHQVAVACTHCAAAHLSCSAVKPCPRCVSKGLKCEDTPRKKRIPKEGEEDELVAALAVKGADGIEPRQGMKRSREPSEVGDDIPQIVADILASKADQAQTPQINTPYHSPSTGQVKGDERAGASTSETGLLSKDSQKVESPTASSLASPVPSIHNSSDQENHSTEALEALLGLADTAQEAAKKEEPQEKAAPMPNFSFAPTLPAFSNAFIQPAAPSFNMFGQPGMVPHFGLPMDPFFQPQVPTVKVSWRFQNQMMPMPLFLQMNSSVKDLHTVITTHLFHSRLISVSQKVAMSIVFAGNKFHLDINNHGMMPAMMLGLSEPSSVVDVVLQ